MAEIKEWLCAAAGTLAPGEVIKPSTLSYLDAMNALEMMDPAMDVAVDFSPHGNFDPGAVLSAAQVIWIMDEMAAREVAWLKGGTMAQTVFSSLHYHNALELGPRCPPSDPDFGVAEAACVAIRAFVLAYAKSVEIVYSTLLDANGPARDGEDVWLDPFGIPVETTESPEEVIAYLEQTMLWFIDDRGLEDPLWEQVMLRLRFRKSWIDALQLRYSRPPPRRLFTHSSSPVPWAFDDVTPFLRQNMPYPTVSIPSHESTWDTLTQALAQLQASHVVGELPQTRMEQFLRSRVDDMLPIVRSIYKIVLCDTPSVDAMVDEWLSEASGQPSGVLARADGMVTGDERRAFSIWRDVLGGTLLLHLSAPLVNPARRRRSFLHLSEIWKNQLATAARIPALTDLVPIVRARSLDCALHAHLLAFSLDLIVQGEMRAAWWAALVIARAARATTWEGQLARAWASVAAGMLLLYTVNRPKAPEPTLSQFQLRHKILSKCVPGLTLGAWEAARTSLNESGLDRHQALSTAKMWFEDARLRFASELFSPELDLEGVKADIDVNITSLVGAIAAHSADRLMWSKGQSGIIPVLSPSSFLDM